MYYVNFIPERDRSITSLNFGSIYEYWTCSVSVRYTIVRGEDRDSPRYHVLGPDLNFKNEWRVSTPFRVTSGSFQGEREHHEEDTR